MATLGPAAPDMSHNVIGLLSVRGGKPLAYTPSKG